jgi:dienelactone hydrolase
MSLIRRGNYIEGGSSMADISGFFVEEFTYDGATRQVFRRGLGPAVVVMHEVPGITPQVVAFAARVADAGFSVYMPLLLGTPMRPLSGGYIASSVFRACISREFRVLAANQSSPIVDWLRALARHAHACRGGPGVGAIGMCLTGNFALAMMLDSPTLAPVLSQPSLPLTLSKTAKSALHVSPREIAAAHEKIERCGARILGLRFHGDPACPAERFARLREEFGDAFEAIEIEPKHANPAGPKPPHSVVTNHLIDREGEPTRAALDRVLSFFKEHLAPAA